MTIIDLQCVIIWLAYSEIRGNPNWIIVSYVEVGVFVSVFYFSWTLLVCLNWLKLVELNYSESGRDEILVDTFLRKVLILFVCLLLGVMPFCKEHPSSGFWWETCGGQVFLGWLANQWRKGNFWETCLHQDSEDQCPHRRWICPSLEVLLSYDWNGLLITSLCYYWPHFMGCFLREQRK